ncbi:UNVERIFIED_CONTAM: Biotin carboxyl carrier protein of acetyl-CoA carboxylase 1, chloroplastic [Sesamum angustifolium]|uniref:Biotin carboxyl carrier protein of acetyl-CoA carboxylase n=1 Tax=Sesamum angustifolium TaxID=2727405 RepID=A0AAW2PR87_9LAMI
MAAAFGAATALTENACKLSTYLPLCRRHFFCGSHSDKVSFRLFAKPELRLSSKRKNFQFLHVCCFRFPGSSHRMCNRLWKRIYWLSYFSTGINDFSFVGFAICLELFSSGKSSIKRGCGGGILRNCCRNSCTIRGSLAESDDAKLSNEPPPAVSGSEESISEFISEVASIIKLVDSKDIVELQLKQLHCELLIRKKEALTPPPAPVTNVQLQTQPAVLAPVPTPPPVPTATPSPTSTQSPAPPKAEPSKSSHPPLKCPMAGTFYRSPAPGEPPFVKVGDKVQKGQVLCIIEAMKLMNEIEADQSGKIVEILAEDGKPVSFDTPLFVIEP